MGFIVIYVEALLKCDDRLAHGVQRTIGQLSSAAQSPKLR